MRLVVVLGVVLIGAGCGRSVTTPQVIEASAMAAPAPRQPLTEKQTAAVDAIREQLDRIDRQFRTPATHPFAAENNLGKLLKAAKAHDEDVPKLRALSRIDDPSMDPRGALAIITMFLDEDPRVSHKMIRKNPKKYSGWAIWLSNAKIAEVREDDQTTRARVVQGGESFFVASRFETPFVDDDTVDVVGYVGGEFDNGKITMPAIAAAAIMKGGSVPSMNRIVKWFSGM